MNLKYGITFIVLGLLLLGGCLMVGNLVARFFIIYASGSFLGCGLAYMLGSPGIWQKQKNGKLSPPGLFLFAPLHALNWFSLLLAVRLQEEEPFHEIVPNLWLGRRLIRGEAAHFNHPPVAAVLDMTAEFTENRALRNENYLCLPTLDHTAPSKEHLQLALVFIGRHISERPVFVHCALGHGRSATIVAAWLLEQNKTRQVEAAVDQIKALRPGIGLNTAQISILKEFFGK